MDPHPELLILGGGVIGLSTAYFLAREGARVQIVDKGDFGQEASWAGAGTECGSGISNMYVGTVNRGYGAIFSNWMKGMDPLAVQATGTVGISTPSAHTG